MGWAEERADVMVEVVVVIGGCYQLGAAVQWDAIGSWLLLMLFAMMTNNYLAAKKASLRVVMTVRSLTILIVKCLALLMVNSMTSLKVLAMAG